MIHNVASQRDTLISTHTKNDFKLCSFNFLSIKEAQAIDADSPEAFRHGTKKAQRAARRSTPTEAQPDPATTKMAQRKSAVTDAAAASKRMMSRKDITAVLRTCQTTSEVEVEWAMPKNAGGTWRGVCYNSFKGIW